MFGILVILLPFTILGQPDSLNIVSEEEQKNEWKFYFGFDFNRSFFAGRPVKINGFRVGAKLNYVHRFGIGIYGLNRDVVFRDVEVNELDATDTSLVKFSAGYGALFYERAWEVKKRWELMVPVYMGAGTIRGSYTDTAGLYQPLLEKPFSAAGVGFMAQYRIFRWFGVKAGVGYRVVFNGDKEIKQAFNGLYYKYGVTILFGELYRMVFKKDELEEW